MDEQWGQPFQLETTSHTGKPVALSGVLEHLEIEFETEAIPCPCEPPCGWKHSRATVGVGKFRFRRKGT